MRKIVSVFAAMFLAAASEAAEFEKSDSNMIITNIRVGQGDATLIQGPMIGGKRINVLFDAGNSKGLNGGKILRRVLEKNGVEELDYMIISHDDEDHIGGIVFGDVLSRKGWMSGRHGTSFVLGDDNTPGCAKEVDGEIVYDRERHWLGENRHYLPDPAHLGTCDDMVVKHWVDYGKDVLRNNHAIRKYNAMADAMGTRLTVNKDNVNTFEIDLGGGAKMEAFAANGWIRGQKKRVENVDSPNESSLAFLVQHGTFDYLIAGDLIGKQGASCKKGKWTRGSSDSTNAKVETALGKAILRSKRKVEVLHVNHHGADNGSSAEFLRDVSPNIAIISAGNGNGHDHPRNQVLQRLYDAHVYQIIQTSWGTTAYKTDNELRHRQAIYQGDIVIRSDGSNYDISTSRTYANDRSALRKELRMPLEEARKKEREEEKKQREERRRNNIPECEV